MRAFGSSFQHTPLHDTTMKPDNESSRCSHLLYQLESSRFFSSSGPAVLIADLWLVSTDSSQSTTHTHHHHASCQQVSPASLHPRLSCTLKILNFQLISLVDKNTRTLYTVGMETYRRYSIGPINIRNNRFLVNFQLKTCDINKLKPIFCLYSFTFGFLQLN